MAWRSRSPAGCPSSLLIVRKSSRSSMIRLNGPPSRTRLDEELLEGPVVEQAGQVVGPCPDLDGAVDLGVVEGDRDLRREQLDQLELLLVEAILPTEPLERQDARDALPTAQRHDDQAAVHRSRRVELEDPRIGQLVGHELGLVVLEDPGRDTGLPRLPRLEVVLGVDPARGQRGEHVGPSVVHLDRDVVVAHEVAEPVGDLVEDPDRIEGGQDRLGDLEELALVAELALERRRPLAQELGRIGVDERLGGEARIDLEQAQVVLREPVETKLGQHEDADDLVVEEHRSEEHRLVQVVLGTGDRLGARVGRSVGQVLGDTVGGNPAGDPHPDPDPELLGRLVDVLADLALEGDRHEVVADGPVDPDVVVVDELAELLRDRQPDLGLRGQPVEPVAELLDRLELSGPGRHPHGVRGGRAARDGRAVVVRSPVAPRRLDQPEATAASVGGAPRPRSGRWSEADRRPSAAARKRCRSPSR